MYDILITLPMFVDTHGVVPTSIYDFFAIAGRTERSKDLPGFLLRSEKKSKVDCLFFLTKRVVTYGTDNNNN